MLNYQFWLPKEETDGITNYFTISMQHSLGSKQKELTFQYLLSRVIYTCITKVQYIIYYEWSISYITHSISYITNAVYHILLTVVDIISW